MTVTSGALPDGHVHDDRVARLPLLCVTAKASDSEKHRLQMRVVSVMKRIVAMAYFQMRPMT